MASTLTSLLYHVVFSTKGRFNFIYDELAHRLFPYMGGIVRENGGHALEVGGISDHVHMLLRLKAATSLADIVRLVKAGSSKWVNEQVKDGLPFAWQAGYGAFTVSESQLKRVQAYIQNQKEHHLGISFSDELKILLEKHRISYHAKYLLD